MNCLGCVALAGINDLADIEIGLGGGRRADIDGFVCHLDMQRLSIGIRIDGNRLDSHPLRRPDDAAGNLAAIGD